MTTFRRTLLRVMPLYAWSIAIGAVGLVVGIYLDALGHAARCVP